MEVFMVSTREILYVLLITLAAGGVYVDDTGAGSGYFAILPLLLLLLLSTDRPSGCVDNCGRVIPCPCNDPCGGNAFLGRVGTTPGGVFGRVF
jgi:hypothetical protein